MTRGTTPRIFLTLPADLDQIAALFITVQQNGKEICTKCIDDLHQMADGRYFVQMTQSDTLKLTAGAQKEVFIQARWRLIDGTCNASEIVRVSVRSILKDGEI